MSQAAKATFLKRRHISNGHSRCRKAIVEATATLRIDMEAAPEHAVSGRPRTAGSHTMLVSLAWQT